MDSFNLKDELLKQKLDYPHKYFNFNNICKPLHLTKEHIWSTIEVSTPPDEEIDRTQEISKKFSAKTGAQLKLLYPKMDVLVLSDKFENIVKHLHSSMV